MPLLQWHEFTEKVSNFERFVNEKRITFSNKIQNFKDDHPLFDNIIGEAILFLPSPFDRIAQAIYHSSEGSKEQKCDTVVTYFIDLQRQGEDHYKKVASQLETILTEISDIKNITAKESTVQLIKEILISSDNVINKKLHILRNEVDKIVKLRNEFHQSYGLNWIPRDYFEAKNVNKDVENWKKGFTFHLPSIKAKREFRRSIVDDIKSKLEAQHQLLIVGKPGTSKSTILMEIICEYFDEGYEILENRDGSEIKNGSQLVKFMGELLDNGNRILIAVDDVHTDRAAAIFYAMDELSTYDLGKNARFLLTARLPDYDLFVTEGLSKVEGEYRQSIAKFRDDPAFKYELPQFTKDEVKEFIRKYRQISNERALEKMSEKVFEDTNGDPILVKFSVLGNGLLRDIEEKCNNYLIDRSTKEPDPLRMQTALLCSILDIERFKITDQLLKGINLWDSAVELEGSILQHTLDDGSWDTLHPYWDMGLILFLYNSKNLHEGTLNRRKEYLKKAIDTIFTIKDQDAERRIESVVALMYDSAADFGFPINIVEDVIKIPDELSDKRKVYLYTNIMAITYGKLRKFSNAIATCNKAIEIDPNYVDAWFNKATSCMHLEMYEEAVKSFDKVIEINDNDAEAWYGKALSLKRLGRDKESDQAFNTAEAISPHLLYARQIQFWDITFKGIDPYSADAYFNEADILYQLGKYDDALKYYDATVNKDPNYTEAWYNKGDILHRKGDYKGALDCYEKAIECYDKDIGKSPYQAVTLNPNAADAWLGKGNILRDKGNYEEAVECYDKAAEIRPDYVVCWNNKGNALYALGRSEEAIKHYDKALEIDPNYAFAWNNKGLALNNSGRYKEAIECFSKAIEIDPNYVDAWKNKALTIVIISGNYNEAIECFDKAIEIDPNYLSSWLYKGLALNLSRRYNEAIECFDIVIEISHNHAQAWFYKGISFEELRNHQEALKCYDKAIEINRNYVDAWKNKSELLYELGNYEDAIKSLDRVIEIEPQNADALYDRACYKIKKGNDVEDGLADLKKAIDINKEYIEMARQDEDFDYIKDDQRFKALL
jgi:tetratricopeptide (TPR) repeat protein